MNLIKHLENLCCNLAEALNRAKAKKKGRTKFFLVREDLILLVHVLTYFLRHESIDRLEEVVLIKKGGTAKKGEDYGSIKTRKPLRNSGRRRKKV